MDEAPDARPWETPPAVPVTTVQPRTRHVLVEIAGAWIEALALELRHAGDSWDVHTAYVLPGAGLVDEWAPISRIRPLHSRRALPWRA
ncbi:hypothetical protein GCM10009763_09360 [Dermacoccus profundi]